MVGVVAEAVRDLRNAGFRPIPLHPHSKKPVDNDWPRLALDAMKFSESSNVGVAVGVIGNNRLDVDIETTDGVELAPAFLPRTGLIHGRPSLPRSHPWYDITGDLPDFLTLKDVEITGEDGEKLVELRWGAGQQCMVPPSIHPDTGEQLEWYSTGEPATVNGVELAQAVRTLAAATLIVRHYPQPGSRHDLALSLAGFLLRQGWDTKRAQHFMSAVANAARDEESEDRALAVATTAERLAAGETAVGGIHLRELLGTAVFARFCKMLGSKPERSALLPTLETEPISAPAIPSYPPQCLQGDYLSELTDMLTDGTPLPKQFAREQIVAILGALADGKLGYPYQRDLRVHRYLLVMAEPNVGKGETWKRIGGEDGALLPLLGIPALGDLKISRGEAGSGQWLAKQLGEEPRTLIHYDEAAKLFAIGSYKGSTLLSEITSLYEGHSVWNASNNSGGKHGTDDAFLSLVVHTTPADFAECLSTKGGMGSGLLSRFTMVHGEEMPGFNRDWEPRDLANEKKLTAAIRAMLPFSLTVPKIADDARACMLEFDNALHQSAEHKRYRARLFDLVKVDLLHRCIYSDSPQLITLAMAERAVAWGWYQLAMRLQFWPQDAKNEVAAMILLLLTRLRKGRCSARDLRRAANLNRSGNHEPFARALVALKRTGEIVIVGKNRVGHEIYALDDEKGAP